MVPIRFRSAPCRNSFANSSAFGKSWFSLLLGATLPLFALQAEKPSPSPAKKEAATEAKENQEESGDDASAMTAMMIKGEPVKGMRYAHRDENDKVVMEFETEVANKIDDENIEMERLKIIAFDDDGQQINIDMPLAIFNVTTRILTGKNQIVIKRDDFEIIGETGEFNTKTRYAKFLGDVKMTILNSENFDQ